MSVLCIYPDKAVMEEIFGEDPALPEGFEEWRSSEFCTHLHCTVAADAYATWNAYGRGQMESERLARQDVGDDIRRLKR